MSFIDERILILASTRKDAESSQKILESHGLHVFICENLKCLLKEIDIGAGAVLIARELLAPDNLKTLSAALDSQSSWSHIPIVVLTREGDFARAKAEALTSLKTLRNATFLERPVRVATFVSVLSAAVANRLRQYEVRELLNQLEASRLEAVRANEAKSEFLAKMSHEIRTPLGAVLGFADLMADGSLDRADRKSYATTIQRNGQLLAALIDDILDLAKVEAGRIDIEAIPTSLFELACEVTSVLEPRAFSKKLKLHVDTSMLASNIVLTDPIRLKQILVNVIGNALKFTSQGEIKVALSSSPITDNQHLLLVDVKDTGVGISEEQEARLFKPFSQADNSTTRAYGGTGLGLILSRQLARAMGGDLILLKSAPNEGSTFRITIKVQPLSADKEEGASWETPPAVGQSHIDGRQILLVEDSPDNQFLIGRILSLAGAKVEFAGDGLEGSEKALGGEFDLVLMDIQMPRMSGHEAVSVLRSKGYGKPVVALTAHALKGERERCLTAGFDDYLTKPIQRDSLIRTVNYILAAKKA